VVGGLDTHGQLPLPAFTSAPWEWEKGSWSVSLSLRGGSGPNEPPARKLADVLDTIRHYGQLQTVIYTDSSAVGGVMRGGSSAVVTSGDPGDPTFLDVRHQCGPECTTSLKVDMWGLWLAFDCLDDEAVAAGVLICSDSQWALNAVTESGHSSHSILAPLWACLRGLRGHVCFQWVPAHWGLLGNERADGEGRKAPGLGPADGVQRGRISFEVVKRLIWSQVMDGPPSHAPTSQVYGDGPFRPLQDASRREKVLLAQFRGVRSLLLGKTQKRVLGTDSTCPRCGEEEDLEHVRRACPKLENMILKF
jgi:ribonuclease HI